MRAHREHFSEPTHPTAVKPKIASLLQAMRPVNAPGNRLDFTGKIVHGMT
jgi:hypothetical protein